jgi:hypothetical protein
MRPLTSACFAHVSQLQLQCSITSIFDASHSHWIPDLAIWPSTSRQLNVTSKLGVYVITLLHRSTPFSVRRYICTWPTYKYVQPYSSHYGKQWVCAAGARQRSKKARQTLCRAFFVEAHGKGHTVAFCMVKPLCVRRVWQRTVKNLCRAFFHDARQKKASDGAGAKRHVTAFAVRQQKNAGLCRAP